MIHQTIKPFRGKQLELFAQKSNKPMRTLSSDWITTKQLCTVLNCSRWHLETLRKQEILKAKKHWTNISPYAARPTYRWHEENCKKAIEQLQKSINDRNSPENLAAMKSSEEK